MKHLSAKDNRTLFIALAVLEIAAQHCVLINFKFVLKDHYPEFRGLVTVQSSSAESYELVNNMDDPFTVMMRYLINVINSPVHYICKMYGIDPETCEPPKRTWEMGMDFYWDRITSGFIVHDELESEDEYDDKQYERNLDIYIRSLILVTVQLVALLETKEMGDEEMIKMMGKEVTFDQDIDFDKPLADAIEGVCEMGDLLLIFKQKIRDKDYNLDWLRKPAIELEAEQ